MLNFLAGGRDIASGVSYVCQGIIRGPAAPLVKRLAYDVVHAAALSDADWANVIEGLKSDLAGTFSLEVRYSCALPLMHCTHCAYNESPEDDGGSTVRDCAISQAITLACKP